jgi:hypothetical protein
MMMQSTDTPQSRIAQAFEGSNSLTDLAARIMAEHEATAVALQRSVKHAMAAGDLLLEAKAQLGKLCIEPIGELGLTKMECAPFTYEWRAVTLTALPRRNA